MNRILVIVLLGLTCGLAAHVSWYRFRAAPRVDSLDAQLAWMQESLALSGEQIARLRALHEQSAPRLMQLASQVGRMREEFSAFERQRQSSGEIDFLEFARFVEQRRALDRECAHSTRRLVAASADLMTPQQREHYLALLGAVGKTSATEAFN